MRVRLLYFLVYRVVDYGVLPCIPDQPVLVHRPLDGQEGGFQWAEAPCAVVCTEVIVRRALADGPAVSMALRLGLFASPCA
mmetsp:Transcript_73773/g.115464  ORF Transcript_73773/g.115464 Transcript_73773/m.115464 type:complete len:81 (+) Transcript_73773:1850-2092(+)